MIQLALFMVHCVGAFALLGMGVLRQALVMRVRTMEHFGKAAHLGSLLSAGRQLAWVFAGMEAATGGGLLVFAPWRQSLFSLAMLVLGIVWIAGVGASRAVRSDLSDTNLRNLLLWGWVDIMGRTARVALLILIALV